MSVYDKQYYQDHKGDYNQNRDKYRKKNLKRIPLDVAVEWYDLLKEYCDANGLKVNAFIKSSCEQVAAQNGYTGFAEYYDEKTKKEE